MKVPTKQALRDRIAELENLLALEKAAKEAAQKQRIIAQADVRKLENEKKVLWSTLARARDTIERIKPYLPQWDNVPKMTGSCTVPKGSPLPTTHNANIK